MCVLHHHVMCGRGYQKVYTSSPNVLDEKVYIYIYLFISFTKMFLYYLFILTPPLNVKHFSCWPFVGRGQFYYNNSNAFGVTPASLKNPPTLLLSKCNVVAFL